MKQNHNTLSVVAAVLLPLMAGCGTKQPAREAATPEPVLAKARTCPGAFVGNNIQISTAIGESNSPVIAWSGDTFAIAWWDLRGRFPTVYHVRVDRSGIPRSPSLQLPNKGVSRDQSLAWDGKETHLVWSDDERIMAVRLPGGDAEPKELAERGTEPAAGAWGAAVWVDGNRLMFRSDGMTDLAEGLIAEEDPEPVAIAGGGIQSPHIAYNGSYYAVVWSASAPGGRQIKLQRVTPKGKRLGRPVPVSATGGISRKPIVAWAGGGFAVAWTNAAPMDQNPRDRYRLFFAVVPEGAEAPTMTRQYMFQGSADQVALAATGKEYALAWVGNKESGSSAIYLQRLDLDGNPVDDALEVTDGVPFACGRPSLAWDGQGYGVVWHDDRAKTGSEVFFAYVECGEEVPEPEKPAGPRDAGVSDAGLPVGAPTLKEAF